MFNKKLILLLISLHLITEQSYCNDGTLDTTFGPNANGTVITPPSNFSATSNVAINSIALQSDGKIIAGGEANPAGVTTFALARYNTNGTLDTTFGSEGTVTQSVGTSQSFINSVAIQSDGKIVAGGISNQAGIFSFTIARFDSNGSLDSSFGTAGIASVSIGTFSEITSIAIQSDGKIVAGGEAEVGGVEQFAIARFNSNGTLDTTFNSSGSQPGVVTLPIGTSSFINSIAIQSDGKIVAGGQGEAAGISQFALARFNSDGSLDSSFGNNGITTEALGTSSKIFAIAIQSNGKIVATGLGNLSGLSVIARFNTDGTLDNTFGTAGVLNITSSDFANATGTAMFSVAIQSNSKIVVGGFANPGGADTFALVRVTANGVLDNSFGTNGTVFVPLTLFGPNPTGASIASIQIDSDGRIVAAGEFNDPSLEYFALARFNVASPSCIVSLPQAIFDKYGV